MTKAELLELIEWELARIRVDLQSHPTHELKLALSGLSRFRAETRQKFFVPGEYDERIYRLWKKDVPVSVIRAVYASDSLFRKIEKEQWTRGAKRPLRAEVAG